MLPIDKFVALLKAKEKPFLFEAPISMAHFMLSYDESINGDDFRPYIIAVLKIKGAIVIKSYVASTIIFTAPIQDGNSRNALKNWQDFLVESFGSKITYMLGVIRILHDSSPVFSFNSNISIESNFDDLVNEIKKKLKEN